MRKVIVSEFITLDGVIEDPGGAEKSKYGGWSMPFGSDEYYKFKFDELFAADAMLLGRVTYQGFAAAWPSMKDEGGFADRMNGLPKYVVSTTLNKADWNNSQIIKTNVAEEVSKLKRQPGKDILVAGSGTLARALMQQNLVDEFRLMVHPIVVGGGKRLFGDGLERTMLALADSRPLDKGVVVLTYRPGGAGG
jgi:dihydrofolate reductase